MAINRAPFNALVDDDGSNSIGTPWNKAAIAGVILDPVDAALAAAGATLRVLGSGSGQTTLASPENIVTLAIPALAWTDAVAIQVTVVHNGGTVPCGLDLILGVGADLATLHLTGATGAGDLLPSTVGNYRVTLRPLPPNAGAAVVWLGSGTVTIGYAQARGQTFGALGASGLATAPGTLFLQHQGVSAGATLYFDLTGHLLTGTAPVGATQPA